MYSKIDFEKNIPFFGFDSFTMSTENHSNYIEYFKSKTLIYQFFFFFKMFIWALVNQYSMYNGRIHIYSIVTTMTYDVRLYWYASFFSFSLLIWMCAHIYVYECEWRRVCMCAWMCLCVRTCTYVYVYAIVCIVYGPE